MSKSDRSYYCSMKFRHIKIDLESGTTYNCHAAKPRSIDLDWLEKNPGDLFNHPISVAEREMMLINQRNDGCEQNCWRAEDIGAISPRLYQKGTERTHTTTRTHPEIVDFSASSNCNLTCSYCTKEYSSAWRRDILEHGDYLSGADERYRVNNKDRVLNQISQSQIKTMHRYSLAFNELKSMAPHLKTITITGGEPLLDNQVIDMITDLNMSDDGVIEVYTGLGLSDSRFKRMLEKFQNLKNLKLIVSSECTEKYLEFNRYGLRWSEFLQKIDHLQNAGVNTIFQSTLTNLTLFGFAEFYRRFKDYHIDITFAYTPTMMSPNVLDDQSKQIIADSLFDLPDHRKSAIISSMSAEPTDSQRKDIGKFLQEFVQRRPDLDIKIYPTNFLKWIGLENYVVQ